MSGNISLNCHHEIENNYRITEQSDNILICGPYYIPFLINGCKRNKNNDIEQCENDEDKNNHFPDFEDEKTMSHFKTNFTVIFACEGVHKISPKVANLQIKASDEFQISDQTPVLSEEDIFVPALSFIVISK